MKLLYSIFLLATFGLVLNNISTPRKPLFTASELQEVHRRLNAIKYL